MTGRVVVFMLLTVVLFCVSIAKLRAQPGRVDSIIQLVIAATQTTRLDTTKFDSAAALLETTELTDAQIQGLEATFIKTLDNGSNRDLSYYLKLSILDALTASDYARAIEYGKRNIEDIERSNTPHRELLASYFITNLRLPYRNSGMIREGFQYYNNRLASHKSVNDSSGLLSCYYVLSGFNKAIGLMDQAIYSMKKCLSYSDTLTIRNSTFFNLPYIRCRTFWINNLNVLGNFYMDNGDGVNAMAILHKAKKAAEGTERTDVYAPLYRNLAQAGIMLNRFDSVMYFIDKAKNDALSGNNYSVLVTVLQLEALFKIKTGEFEQAEQLLNNSWQLIHKYKIPVSPYPGTTDPDYYLALLRIEQGRYNEAILLIDQDVKRVRNLRNELLRDYKLLAEIHGRIGAYEPAAGAYARYVALQDSIMANQKKYQSVSFEVEQKISERELSIARLQNENQLSAVVRNFSAGLALLLLLLAGMIYYRFRSKQKANQILQKTLSELQSTQSQLIQSEKMASLGELTAGIAHEIQNPLNFVNNFSEVNSELLSEMREELLKRNYNQVDDLAKDIADNERKINEHGKRAESIVRGMLLHSRSNTGVKELTDINKQADEYLRLSYHGFRAKDKTFNAEIQPDYDPSVGPINVVPQEIGRVLLNLFNNAFYAVNEKKSQQQDGYEPMISVSTKRTHDKIIITVKDNGNGIPQKVVDKIFQPFFTTKPTGQGTGLGLSLAYDIVKAHQGEIAVSSVEGIYSAFVVTLPV